MSQKSITKSAIKHLGQVGLAILSFTFLASPVAASDPAQVAKDTLATEGGKEVLNEALKVARSKPALSVATTIVCVACVPVAGASASASMCVACGILLAKVIG